MRWSEQQLADYLEKTGTPAAAPRVDVSDPPFAAPKPTALQAMQALGRLPVGKMNKTEKQYDGHLAQLKYAGKILWHEFEAIKLRLADNTFYTPDFAVMAADGVIELHEVKGFWTDDARVKIKVAADKFPFRFMAMKPRTLKAGGGWEVEEF
jgi:hypothetical protein